MLVDDRGRHTRRPRAPGPTPAHEQVRTRPVALPHPGPSDTISAVRLGRTFIGPTFDVLLIGGVLSLPVALVAYLVGFRFDCVSMWQVLLLTTYAHVAASLMRLYSVPGAIRSRPFLTLGFPVVTAVVTGAVVISSSRVFSHVQGLYLSWSAYHYAAQTYGIALLYIYRSGGTLSQQEKTFLRAACLATFFYALLKTNSGVAMIIPASVYTTWPALETLRTGVRALALVALVAAPVALAVHRWRRGQALPGMSLVLLFTNAVWWVVFPSEDAFAWAAISHGVQYMAIATLLHVKEATVPVKEGGSQRAPAYRAAAFYAGCVALAYALYYGAPPIYGALGTHFTHSAAFARIALMLNFHHVILDGFIWKRRQSAPAPVREVGAPLGVPAT